MSRNGKIARLPRPLREEVNRRLANGMTARGIVAWLNDRTDVQQMLAERFGGSPVNEQNLSEWKQGGFAEWQARQETLGEVREAARDAEELGREGGALGDHAARVLEAKILLTLAEWDGDPEHPAMAKLRAMSAVSRELVALRRGDHSAARLGMEQARFDREQAAEKVQDDMEVRQQVHTEFRKWLQLPEIRKALENGCLSEADRIQAIQRRVWGDQAGTWLRSGDERRQIQASRGVNGDGI